MASQGLEELQASLDDDATTSRSSRSCRRSAPRRSRKQGEEAPVVRLVNVVLMSAIQKGASDIHIEPYEKELRVRFRIDGILYNIMAPPMKFRDAITSRIKIMAKLDIAEKRLPQDGRIKIRFNDNGAAEGDRLPRLGAADALRREDRHASARQGQADARHDEARLRARVAAQVRGGDPQAVGHGAGHRPDRQRQDQHALLVDRARSTPPETNIMTAEDPVEFNLVGVNQVQVRENIGLNFAAALRSFLRQDPNIILVGEIRDFETAEIAVKAALTGHLVLSTLHTNDAPSTINRLMNMGIEPFLVASSVHLICAQRLVRRICAQLQGAASARRRRRWCRPASRRTRRRRSMPMKGTRLREVQQHRLQGPRRPLRSDGDRRGAARADPRRRLGPRAAAQGGRRRDDHAARAAACARSRTA